MDAGRRHRHEAAGLTSIIGPTPVSHKGSTTEWYTPPEIFEAMGVRFVLDPASPVGGLPWVPAMVHYDKEIDGLTQPWFGLVWLNPPFGREVGAWMRRMAEHGDGVALVAARLNTKWWHESVVPHATGFCMLLKRPYFINERHERAPFNSGGDIVLVAYGEEAYGILDQSGLGGMARLR